ncbi:MAG: hypothetical protein ACL93V_16025 [Candidatus Electrothrix sp. YB6]
MPEQNRSACADADTENSIRQEQLASLGTLLADFSHEIRNHLSVIREANGLLEDMLAMSGRDDPLSDRARETTALIERRISNSATLCCHLSGVAHRSDTPLSSFHLHELLAELTALFARSARSREIDLRLEPGPDIQPVYNDPALLQHVIYRLYIFCLEHLDRGQTLVLGTAREEDCSVVFFRLPGMPHINPTGLSQTVQAAVARLAGRVEENNTPDAAGLRLVLEPAGINNSVE